MIGIYVLNVLMAIEFEIDSLKCKIAPQVPELLRNNPRPKIKVKFVGPKWEELVEYLSSLSGISDGPMK